ncbi:HAD family hydrolase [Campylobacter sp. MIT 21-1685]|uniref:D-glycero-alpha-D-manno-heptose-1,7-bisphosphate 7-phosphatase n=1 Tax=unclassified Campylobacter TaxID=2593542 RepID=UPI00224B417C|nr:MULTISPECIES: HAD family hydrolase [unclassified Campylobacter]MCX2683687.1 HAD family hydrolase [Campylobacter sp. MIT 21-1684]MCX2751972.1 HAD family hydrolase [Campylobacter sp. MIT 21-1682]MCX2808166.1 HAD family hydrolase [Campylobacter sp. MIT 21-1685]
MKNKAVFLDRDGVINIDKHYVYKIQDFEFCEGIFELCRFFQEKAYLLFVITNQSGIERGYYTEEDFKKLSTFMLKEFEKQGVKITKIYHCPHLHNCECRKPKPAMLLKANKEFNLDLSTSIFIGDSLTDMQAGVNAGVGNLVLIKQDGMEKENSFQCFSTLTEILNFYTKN